MSLKIFNFLKKYKLVLLVLLVFSLSFVIAPSSLAGTFGDWAGEVVGGIIYVFIWTLGLVLILVMKGLLLIATYQNFINSGAVIEGWVVVRDLANMFFVVILLVIAFATILHLEEYNYKKWLPKLILMAVLINFSKTICGLMIDVAQIIMLTFVNAFKDVAGGNLVDMLGIKSIVTIANESDDIGFWAIVGAYILGLIYMIVALVVITTMMMVLVMRLVMIWIYVVLSPLAYLLSAFPGGQSYAKEWWSEFIKNLVVGPVLAFFIWLSFAALQTGSYSTIKDVVGSSATSTEESSAFANSISGNASGSNKAGMATEASTPGVLIKFVIGIGMLIGGLKISQQIGGAAGSVAGKGMSQLSSMGAATAGFSKKWAGKIVSGDNMLARKTMKGAGFDFRPTSIVTAIKAGYNKTKQDDNDEIRTQGVKNLDRGGFRAVLGGVGAGQDWADNYTSGFLGLKGVAHGIREMTARPIMRKVKGKQLDEEQAQLKTLEAERETYITTKDHAAEQTSINDKKKDVSAMDRDINDINTRIRTGGLQAGDSEKLKQMQTKRDEAQQSVDDRQKKLDGRTVDDAKYDEYSDKITAQEASVNSTKESLSRIATPKALESRGEYRKIINDRKTKYKDVTNSDELLQLYEDAVRRKNKFDQVAIVEKLSNDGNLNEILRTKGYASNAVGMVSFLNNDKNEKGERKGLNAGLGGQEILQLQNDLSESEERVGHWEMAKTVGVNAHGKMESLVKKKTSNGNVEKDANGKEIWDDEQHVIAAASEVAKMDPQKVVIQLNRLAYGGEDANGKFKLSNLGKVLVKMLDQNGTFKAQEGRINQNIAVNLTSGDTLDELIKMGISKISLDSLQKRGNPDGQSLDPAIIIDALKKAGYIS